jgi:hypothetical protein
VLAPLAPLPAIGKLEKRAIVLGKGAVAGTVEITTLEIGVPGRWDALALSQRLSPYHSFLVQYESERWVVHAQAPGCHGERLESALSAIEEWLVERQIEDAPVRVDGRRMPVPRRQAHRPSAGSPYLAA